MAFQGFESQSPELLVQRPHCFPDPVEATQAYPLVDGNDWHCHHNQLEGCHCCLLACCHHPLHHLAQGLRVCWLLLSILVCAHQSIIGDIRFQDVPLEETPAPISMSGSSTTRPGSIPLPPVPPYSADTNHFRSASVRQSIGIMLTPLL